MADHAPARAPIIRVFAGSMYTARQRGSRNSSRRPMWPPELYAPPSADGPPTRGRPRYGTVASWAQRTRYILLLLLSSSSSSSSGRRQEPDSGTDPLPRGLGQDRAGRVRAVDDGVQQILEDGLEERPARVVPGAVARVQPHRRDAAGPHRDGDAREHALLDGRALAAVVARRAADRAQAGLRSGAGGTVSRPFASAAGSPGTRRNARAPCS